MDNLYYLIPIAMLLQTAFTIMTFAVYPDNFRSRVIANIVMAVLIASILIVVTY